MYSIYDTVDMLIFVNQLYYFLIDMFINWCLFLCAVVLLDTTKEKALQWTHYPFGTTSPTPGVSKNLYFHFYSNLQFQQRSVKNCLSGWCLSVSWRLIWGSYWNLWNITALLYQWVKGAQGGPSIWCSFYSPWKKCHLKKVIV